MQIEQANSTILAQIWNESLPLVQQSASIEDAAQTLTQALYRQFSDSLALARVFLTVPFDDLPLTRKSTVREWAESERAGDLLKPTTPVLSLVGSHGVEDAWCDPGQSQDHGGIPLISASFVVGIPMIYRLLMELKVPVGFLESHKAEIIIETIGRKAGLFFVEAAAAAQDSQGRKIIAAESFVSNYGIKTVFGIGGGYDIGQIVVMVFFCRETLSRSTAELFLPLTGMFQSQTSELIGRKQIFAAK